MGDRKCTMHTDRFSVNSFHDYVFHCGRFPLNYFQIYVIEVLKNQNNSWKVWEITCLIHVYDTGMSKNNFCPVDKFHQRAFSIKYGRKTDKIDNILQTLCMISYCIAIWLCNAHWQIFCQFFPWLCFLTWYSLVFSLIVT